MFSKYHTGLIAVLIILLSSFVIGQSKPKPKPKPTAAKATAKPAAPAASPTPAATPTPAPTPAAPVKCEANGLTESEKAEIVDGHNKLREPLGLMPLVWDCALANLAQDWAGRSQFEHRETSFGENIFVSANPAEPIATVLGRWMSERANWDNTAGVCAEGKVCTHYTQMVWRATAKFGCGINREAVGKWRAMLVCNYDPASRSSGPAY